MFCCVATTIHPENCVLTANSLIWHSAQANSHINFLEIVLFWKESKYWSQACITEPNNHEFLHYLIFNLKGSKIILSHYLTFRKWIAGWIKYEKAISLHWPVDRWKCSVASPRGHQRTVAIQWHFPITGAFAVRFYALPSIVYLWAVFQRHPTNC